MTSRPSLLLALILTYPSIGCGTNAPEIPPELLADTASGNQTYPPGPYGTEVGDTVEDLVFEGWSDPAAAKFDSAAFERLAFSDWYNPHDSSGAELLLINTTAAWCQSCRIEHADLPARHLALAPRGLVILALMYQDAAEQPASPEDLEVWTRQFETNFPMALDPDFLMGRFVPADVAPLNLLVDARTMVVLERFIGDQTAVIWPTIEQELTNRGR